MNEVNYKKFIDEGTAVRDKVVINQTELTDKIFKLVRRRRGQIEFRLDLTDKEREMLEPFLKRYKLEFSAHSDMHPIEYGTKNGFLLRTFFKMPKLVQADYIICKFNYEFDEATTRRYREPENEGSKYYRKTFIDTNLDISFRSDSYENSQFCNVELYSLRHFCADVYEGYERCSKMSRNWMPKCIEFPTKENACFWLWFVNKVNEIKEGEKKEYERLLEEKRKEQAEMDKFAELAKSM